MLSKAKIKQINSLRLKKFRKSEASFFVEGEKNILELIRSDLKIRELYLTEHFLNRNFSTVGQQIYQTVSEKDLERVGSLQTNNAGIAVVEMRSLKKDYTNKSNITLVLDGVNDPGNLGTIVRIADWYGINIIICSSDTADFYNPKTINATMGSFTRVNVLYKDLVTYLQEVNTPVLGAALDGESVYHSSVAGKLHLVMGSESHGISKEVEECLTQKITIPRIGDAESLNVSVATAIICDNLRKK